MTTSTKSTATTNVSRVTRSKQDCANSYDTMSSFYDFMTASSEREFTEKGLEQFDAKSGERILEIGYGTGFALKVLAEKVGTSGKVVGIDISPKMKEVAAKKLEEAKLLSRVELLVGDALHLPFNNKEDDDESLFDGVFMSFTLELFDNDELIPMIQEISRVLKFGGRMTIVALVRKVECVSVQLYEWFHEKMPIVVDY